MRELIEKKIIKTTSSSPFCWKCAVEEEKTGFRERKSNFSLDFPAFGLSVLVGLRRKVDLRYKGYAWTPILWSFDNSKR